MNKIILFLTKISLIFSLIFFPSVNIFAEEIETVLQKLQEDIKTLEKAVYSQDLNTTSTNGSLSSGDNDILTKHLLKLSELEEQFKNLTNSFEEVNFKLDKLSNRITKVQTDNQMRFQDLENLDLTKISSKKKIKKLPGSSKAQDLGQALEIEVKDSDTAAAEQIQRTQSIESVGTIVDEDVERVEKILPKASPEEQYKFAVSFIQVGDYETAELALREFVDTNSNHKLAGNAQYWYGETFRIRQLYQDAATAYLNGYQKYPKSTKAPVNLLKLGVMLVQIGEKEQGCSMILGVKDQYPKANQSVIQKAEYEKKKFNCGKKS
jgi:tol-pal system protein YbgF